ncbi:SseB family protein [Arthrobacter sp. AQ5-05]|uniref:SseB family protein n=1 Tax=Arthrobacter sp. AQ5-05 TaxID=2184581 RepID=UPI000DCD45AB|nr:SseB family protein [Arthrobacter sp. AQ5-05]RAX49019.1 SseB family protein [Arthrobacter sp. AQ5-05]
MSANSPSSHAGQGAERHLPGHIAAALQRAGGAVDSAGQSWEGRDLSGEGNPLHNFDNDNGLIDPKLEAALAALVAGTGSEQQIHAALAEARVYIAVVAQLAEGGLGEHGFTEDKEADMALVTLTAPDGRTALPVFSSVDNLQAWHAEARPVAVFAPRAALSAVSEEAQMLVLDPGTDFTFVLRRPGMWALAQQRAWTPSYLNEELAVAIEEQVASEDALAAIHMAPGQGVGTRTAAGTAVPGGGSGPELRLEFFFRPGTDEAAARDCVTRVHTRLAADRHFAENVDSLEVALRAAPGTGA